MLPATVESKVARAAEILGLNELLQRYPRQLSGGQRQRVAMGRAIVRNPQVFPVSYTHLTLPTIYSV